MLSPMGKALRLIRIQEDERLFEMAERLGVTSSFISAIEMGRKAPPKDFADRVISTYALGKATAAELRTAAAASQRTFNIEPKSALARDTAGLLAQRFASLSDDDLNKIKLILGGE